MLHVSCNAPTLAFFDTLSESSLFLSLVEKEYLTGLESKKDDERYHFRCLE